SVQLWTMVILDLRAGRTGGAAAHLREQLQIATQTGLRGILFAGLDGCGHLCAATGRPADAVTVWAAMSALGAPWPSPHGSRDRGGREEVLHRARQLLGPAGARAAQERGTAMSLAAATEYAVMLAAAEPSAAASAVTAQGLAKLSPRERELVTLVA